MEEVVKYVNRCETPFIYREHVELHTSAPIALQSAQSTRLTYRRAGIVQQDGRKRLIDPIDEYC